MADYSDPAITEAYEIEKTVEVHLASNRVYRIEAMRRVKGRVSYDVRYYERQMLYKTPKGDIVTDSVPLATPFYVWVPDSSMPPVDRHSAESALDQASGWLAERRNNQNRIW
jgi:hypothetical protein